MMSRTASRPGHGRRALAATIPALALAVLTLVGLPVGALAADPDAVGPGDQPSQVYLDAMAHADGTYAFTPGAPAEADARSFALAGDAASTPAVGRVIYGFLPYWTLADPDTRLDFSVLTHVAYFSVGADARGNLRKRDPDGSLTTGWAGWTSSAMTSVINAAHARHRRVTLTLSVFAWTTGQAAVQKALLGSAGARQNLARQAAAAVRDRGADGINLDFEPLVAGSEDDFVALVRAMRAELDAVIPRAHLSFDTLGRPGNYPLERALAKGGADAVLVMGYDYRTASAPAAGSIDPLAGPGYDLAETVRTYTARVPASRVILGLPYYGRAWSTVSDAVNARTQTGAKYGYSAAVEYATAVEYAAKHGRRYDSREVAAWTAYKKESCTPAFGCVTTWRQLYYDDAATLGARYDLVNRARLRGVGIWALGYDGKRKELYRALAAKLVKDTTAPAAGIAAFPVTQPDTGFIVRWTAEDDWNGIAGYDVQVSAGGGAWSAWLTGTKATSAAYLGSDNTGYAFRVRARDGKGNLSAWNVSSVHVESPALAPGGFLRVSGASLNVRSAPATSAPKVATAQRGDVFAITGGPRTADGHTWYRVTGPLATWGAVGDVESSAWVAASGTSGTHVAAAPAPNATLVRAGIRAVEFSGGGPASLGANAAAVGQRSFSPNGDGSGDVLVIGWDNRRALDRLTLRVLGPDGTVLGTRPVPATASGPQELRLGRNRWRCRPARRRPARRQVPAPARRHGRRRHVHVAFHGTHGGRPPGPDGRRDRSRPADAPGCEGLGQPPVSERRRGARCDAHLRYGLSRRRPLGRGRRAPGGRRRRRPDPPDRGGRPLRCSNLEGDRRRWDARGRRRLPGHAPALRRRRECGDPVLAGDRGRDAADPHGGGRRHGDLPRRRRGRRHRTTALDVRRAHARHPACPARQDGDPLVAGRRYLRRRHLERARHGRAHGAGRPLHGCRLGRGRAGQPGHGQGPDSSSTARSAPCAGTGRPSPPRTAIASCRRRPSRSGSPGRRA